MAILIYPVKKRREIFYKIILVIFFLWVLISILSFFLIKKHSSFVETKTKKDLLEKEEINQIRKSLSILDDPHFQELKESFLFSNFDIKKLPPEAKGKKNIFSSSR